MPYGPMFAGAATGKIPLLLIAMALGFWVLTLADNNANPLKLVGRVTGWLIMIVSVGGLICSAVFGMCHMRNCSVPGIAGGCPGISDMEKK